MSRIDECIEQYRDWCAKLGIVTISDLNQMITRGEVNRLINLSEIWQEQKISEIAKDIKDNIEKRKIILISGPSSSGKTSFANRLSLHLKVLGIGSLALSLDDYYLPAELIPSNEKGEKDLETIEAIDYAHFNRDIESLITGRETDLPIFDFITARPSDRVKRVSLCENEVIIVEGIHGLNPKLLSNISDENKYKIYCSALTALRRDDMTKINSRTTRLIRRIIRDHFFRGTSAKDTLLRWRSVEEGAAKHIFPYTDNADIIFNSSILYEHCVYKIYLNELLFGMTDGTSGYETVQELSDLINRFKLIDRDMVPRTSLVREFVGGSTLIE